VLAEKAVREKETSSIRLEMKHKEKEKKCD
jgi:hypothetical protein